MLLAVNKRTALVLALAAAAVIDLAAAGPAAARGSGHRPRCTASYPAPASSVTSYWPRPRVPCSPPA